MNQQESGSLREALERSLKTLPTLGFENGYPVQAMPKAEILSLLALHPEPAREPSDAAVEAGANELYERLFHLGITMTEAESATRAALVAARPYLMPTREEIAEALHREKHSEACLFSNPSNCDQFRQAVQESDAVLALLSTSGESGEGSEFICSVSPDGRHNTVPARGGDDEPLGYNHCGYCGTKLDW